MGGNTTGEIEIGSERGLYKSLQFITPNKVQKNNDNIKKTQTKSQHLLENMIQVPKE